MQRKAVSVIFVILVTLFMPLLFVACDKPKDTLRTPTLTLSKTNEGFFANHGKMYFLWIDDVKSILKPKNVGNEEK